MRSTSTGGSIRSAAALSSSVALITSIALTAPGAARAQPPPEGAPSKAEEPAWYKGVPEERQQKAKALFQEGRELHRALILADARAKYEEALTHWEHPELRLYLGRLLMRVGLPLLAHESLEKALRWGPGALDKDDDKEARAAMRELEQKQLGAIKIRCDEPGAAVLLDGKPWFSGAGAERRLVLPGEHVITARKAGYYTMVKPVAVFAGKEAAGDIHLSVDTTIVERRWSTWKPWALVGAGAALGALGGGLQALATKDHDDAAAALRQSCAGSCGPDTSGVYDRSRLENGLAIGSFVVGGAALLTGVTMVFLNLPRSYRSKDEGDVKVEVSPVVSPTAAGLSARITF